MSETKIRISGLSGDSIVDGRGLRYTIFTQGCPHGCPGCHNPQTHDFSDGTETTVAAIMAIIKRDPLLDGITLSGGEPFSQPEPCAELAREAKALGLNVWVYSGWTFEELLAMPEAQELLALADVLVDGRYIAEQRTLSTPFVGSRNQRLIDVPKSLIAGKAVILA